LIERGMSDFERRELGEMVAVGATDATGVRLWVRTLRPGRHHLELWSDADRHAGAIDLAPPPGADGTTSFRYPDDVDGAAPLAPVTAYRFRLRRDDAVIGEGRFETAPSGVADTPARFAFAVMSCHQPFDDDGALHPPSLAMLDVLDRVLVEHDVKRVFLMGDQMYVDYPRGKSPYDDDFFATVAPPGRRSLLDCTPAEVRALYQRRHRAFWSIERFRELLARYPCHPLPDDHELRDNFGTAPEHAGPAWAAVRRGALDAFDDYQGLLLRGRDRPRPEAFDYQVDYGDVAVYGLDVRSQRRHDGEAMRMCADEQFAAFERFLAGTGDKQVVLVVVSVPLMIFPSWVVEVGIKLFGEDTDAADRWSNPAAARSRQRLTRTLFEHQRGHPDQRIVLVSGDIHLGCAVRFVWRQGDVRPVYQLVSSALSNLSDAIARKLGAIAPSLDQALDGEEGELWARVELLPCGDGSPSRPYTELNVGIVEMLRQPDGSLAVRLGLIGRDGDDPAVVFASEPL
jgi:alkaline phosphatase D